MTETRLDYRSAGVDLDAAERTKEGLRALVSSTRDSNTLSELGAFGGLYAVPEGVDSPVLVSSADGVGTKLKVAFAANRHDTVGQDLVNHCVNDILVQGARPLFFLDYLATGVLEEQIVNDVVRGVAIACKANRCALLGGETAQMPDFYAAGEYDLAGFIVGVVERDSVVDGSRIEVGDALVALPSTGLQTNGYTLARKILFEVMGLTPEDPFPGSTGTVADELLSIHSSFLDPLMPELELGTIRGLAHITGGGILGNLPRTLGSLGATIDLSSWVLPNVFTVLAEGGNVAADEMFRVFNMGIGMIAVTQKCNADAMIDRLRAQGTAAWRLGEVTDDGEVSIR